MTDRLYRSTRERMLGGVCGGLAEYFQIDVTLIRLITVVIAFAGGIGFFGYFIAWIIIPRDPAGQVNYGPDYHQGRNVDNVVETVTSNIEEAARTLGEKARDFGEAARNGWEKSEKDQHINLQKDQPSDFHPEWRGRNLAGWILIILGLLFFLDRWFPLWFGMGKMWPLLLVLIGLVVIFRRERR